MKIRTLRALRFSAIVCAFSIASITASSGGQSGWEAPPQVLTPTVVATGLRNPRGIKFGPDGRLYVAEGGLGGSRSTVGQCTQVPAPNGPYTGGFTGRISAVDVTTGVRTTVVRNLPSSQTAAATGGFASSVADVAFLNGTLYALTAGAGCSHGLAGTFNRIDRITPGVATPIVNLSRFLKTHPVAHPNPGDFEPDGAWYSLEAAGDALYAVEPNHGEVDVVKPDGSIGRLVDVSATQGHIVPTALTSISGPFLLGNLNVFAPGAQDHAKIFLLTSAGQLLQIASGLTAVTGVRMHNGRIYALESFTGFYAPAPPVAHSGKVVRLELDGSWHTIVNGLSFPTAMTFGDRNTLYISNKGYGQPTNTSGEIVKVQIGD
ncbi:MAG: ScyD/ScyE family protein [Candidatus Eremiobacteraeota bacterium]|nr:ScyD/ScyE family protein [Candidatus Eremiobacteraeota bacterium]